MRESGTLGPTSLRVFFEIYIAILEAGGPFARSAEDSTFGNADEILAAVIKPHCCLDGSEHALLPNQICTPLPILPACVTLSFSLSTRESSSSSHPSAIHQPQMKQPPAGGRQHQNPLESSGLEDEVLGVLDDSLEGLQELGGHVAVDVAVVGGEVDGHEGLDADHAVDGHDGGLGGTHREDRTLARGQDRVEAVHAEHAEVGDGEVAAGVVRGAETGAASLLHQVLPLATNLVHVGAGGVLEHGGDEALLERHGDGDVHLLVVHDGVTRGGEGGEHDGVLSEGDADSLREEGGHCHTLRLDLLVEGVELVGAHLHGDAGDGNLKRGHHVLAHGLLHAGEGHGGASRGGEGRGRGGGGGRTRGGGGSSGGGSRGGRGGRGGGGQARGLLDVARGDAAVHAGALHGGEVDPVLLGDLLGVGSGDDATVGAALHGGGSRGSGRGRGSRGSGRSRDGLGGGGGRGSRGGLRRGGRGRGGATRGGSLGLGLGDLGLGLGDEGDGRADGGHLSVGHGDVREVAVVEGLDVHVGLVGLDDDDGLALADLLALALEPGDDLALGHGGGERGHVDLLDLGTDRDVARGGGAGDAGGRESAAVARERGLLLRKNLGGSRGVGHGGHLGRRR